MQYIGRNVNKRHQEILRYIPGEARERRSLTGLHDKEDTEKAGYQNSVNHSFRVS